MVSYYGTFKIVLLGDSASKTALIQRFLTNLFVSDQTMTIGIDFEVKSLTVDGKKVKLQIWDFDGKERFRFLLPNYVRGADGALFIYDIANYTSINNIDDWLSVIRKEDRAEIPILLVGITSDEKNKRQVSVEDGKEIAKSKNLNGFIECNLKTGKNVEKAFEALTRLILADIKNNIKKTHKWVENSSRSYLKLKKKKKKSFPKTSSKPAMPPPHPPPEGLALTLQDIKSNQDQITNILSIIKRYWQLQNSRIIAFTLVQGKDTILYSTDNKNISVDVGRIRSSWNSMNAQFIMISGVKYSVILNTPNIFIVNSIGSKDYIVLAKDDEYTYIFHVEPNGEPTLEDTPNAAKRLSEGLSNHLSELNLRLRAIGQARAPLKKEDREKEVHCQYCGRKLTKEEQFTHSCNRFFLG